MVSIQLVLSSGFPNRFRSLLHAATARRNWLAAHARAISRDQWFGAFFTLAYIAFFVILFTEPSSVPIAGR